MFKLSISDKCKYFQHCFTLQHADRQWQLAATDSTMTYWNQWPEVAWWLCKKEREHIIEEAQMRRHVYGKETCRGLFKSSIILKKIRDKDGGYTKRETVMVLSYWFLLTITYNIHCFTVYILPVVCWKQTKTLYKSQQYA